MPIIEFMDAVLNDEDTAIEIYSIEVEDTVWTGIYDGVQPRDCIPEKYWNEEVNSFQFDKNSLCINY